MRNKFVSEGPSEVPERGGFGEEHCLARDGVHARGFLALRSGTFLRDPPRVAAHPLHVHRKLP